MAAIVPTKVGTPVPMPIPRLIFWFVVRPSWCAEFPLGEGAPLADTLLEEDSALDDVQVEVQVDEGASLAEFQLDGVPLAALGVDDGASLACVELAEGASLIGIRLDPDWNPDAAYRLT
jgi:hypothetical protein